MTAEPTTLSAPIESLGDQLLATTAVRILGGMLGFVDRRPSGGSLVLVERPGGPLVSRGVHSTLVAALDRGGEPLSEVFRDRLLIRRLPGSQDRVGCLLDTVHHLEPGRVGAFEDALAAFGDVAQANATAVDTVRAHDSRLIADAEQPLPVGGGLVALLKDLPELWRVVDNDGRVVHAAAGWSDRLGVPQSRICGADASASMHPDSKGLFEELVEPVLASKGVVRSVPCQLLDVRGASISTLYSASLNRDPDGRVVGRVELFVENLTQSHETESTAMARLAASSSTVHEFADFALGRLQRELRMEVVLLSIPSERGGTEIYRHPHDLDRCDVRSLLARWQKRLATRLGGELIPDSRLANREAFPLADDLDAMGLCTAFATTIRLPGDRVVGTLIVGSRRRKEVTVLDQAWVDGIASLCGLVEHRDRAQSERQREGFVAQATLAAVSEAVIRTDSSDAIEIVNPSAERLLGLARTQLIGQKIEDVLDLRSEAGGDRLEHPLSSIPVDSGDETNEAPTVFRCVASDERWTDVQASLQVLHSEDGRPLGSVLTLRDVTKSHAMSKELAHRASHDSLTGLVNRAEFDRRLHEVTQSGEYLSTVCLLDLDRFKPVNDACGHHAGDELLRRLAELLRGSVRATDVVARIGGDEFAILLTGCSLEHGEQAAEKILSRIQKFRFAWEGEVFGIGASIGVAEMPWPIEPDEALRRAEEACRLAKNHGRNRIECARSDAAPSEDTPWSVQIPRLLDEGRFELYAQPICETDPATSRMIGCETLMRVRMPDGTLGSPYALLTAAERHGMSGDVDKAIVDRIFDLADQMPDQMRSMQMVTINLSGRSLDDRSVGARILERLDRSPVDASCFGLEVTETAAITNLGTATSFLGELRDRGCRILLDDFGAGFSTFSYLQDLPVTDVKIDGRFVHGMSSNQTDLAVVRAVYEIAKSAGIRTIAEKVESEQVRSLLAEIGVSAVQGYGVAMPGPFLGLLERGGAAGIDSHVVH